ncbi:MAG: OmpA family protein [Candidatus Dasytiphilus stammeri]
MLSNRQKKNENSILAQEVIKKRSNVIIWLLPLLVISLLFLYWYFQPLHKKESKQISNTPLHKLTSVKVGNITTLPDGVTISMQNDSVEAKLLKFIQDPTQKISDKLWLNLDYLVFDRTQDDAKIEAKTHLQNLAAILKAYPNVKIKIGGYTDSIGGTENNIVSSQARAESVRKELIDLKIAPERVLAQGYGDKNPIASNNITTGIMQTRGVSINVLEK